MTTVIGPVGPETCAGVPPNIAAKNPQAIAPYRPAIAPAPEATPNASANGRATTAAVNPPKISPRSVERLIRIEAIWQSGFRYATQVWRLRNFVYCTGVMPQYEEAGKRRSLSDIEFSAEFRSLAPSCR
jgi:hypothetical protein